MISFRFRINDSFRRYSTHPITVPKTQVEYKKIEQEGFSRGDLTIIFPKGERIRGHMYSGVAGFGPYYQIRFYPNQHLPEYLATGTRIMVLLHKDGNHCYAIMEFRD